MATTPESASPKTILVVEDDRTLLELIQQKLAKTGFRVLAAESGEKALEILKGERPDIVWLDLMLPGIHGFEVLRWMREQEATRDISVMVVTAFGDEKNRKEAVALSVSDFVVKADATLDEIVERVKQHVGK